MPRYAFGDEAGETGFKFERGSSRFFVVAFVFVDDPQPLRERIERLKREMGLSSRYEFKFNKMSRRFRQAFLAATGDAVFRATVLVVDKQALLRHWQRVGKLAFYVHFVGDLIASVPQREWEGTRLILDRFGQHRETVRQLKRYLRKQGIVGPNQIVAKRSEGEPLIQLADTVAGAVFRRYATGEMAYLDQLSGKVSIREYKGNPPG